jgi:hypothetical protein
LPYDSCKIVTFLYERRACMRPADDFGKMSEELGRAWWTEKNRTRRTNYASQKVFEKAQAENTLIDSVKPLQMINPRPIGKCLNVIGLDIEEINSPHAQRAIKAAYRGKALKYHPDAGGDQGLFVELQSAYQELMSWAKNPQWTKRRGLLNRWFYDGEKNKWAQPIPDAALCGHWNLAGGNLA